MPDPEPLNSNARTHEVVLRKFIVTTFLIAVSGCSSMPTEKMDQIKSINHHGKSTSTFLQEMEDKGLFCQRLERFESDNRLKSITDGTLNEVQFHECMAESDGFFCVARSGTFITSQYNKVIKVNGTNNSKTCIWN